MKKAKKVAGAERPLNARELDTAIARGIFGMNVVGWWYTYWTDEDGKHVCDQEPGNWWTGTSEKEPVYLNEHCPAPSYAEQKQMVLGHYHHNLRPVPEYSGDWDHVGRLLLAIFEKGWDAEISSYSKGGKIHYRADVQRIKKQQEGWTRFDESGPMALALAIVDALELHGEALAEPTKEIGLSP